MATTFGEAFRSGKTEFIGNSPTRRLNDQTSNLLLLTLGISVIPYASVRPFFWALWALVLGGLMLWYLAVLHAKDYKLRRPFSSFRLLSIPFLAVAGWMAIQILPLGHMTGLSTFTTQTGTEIHSTTLSISPSDSFLALLRWLTYGAIFFLVSQVAVRKGRARYMLWGFLIIIVLQALYAFVALYYLGDGLLVADKTKYFGDAIGTFINRNSLATYLAFGTVIATALSIPSTAPERYRDHGRATKRSPRRAGGFAIQNLYAIASLAIIFAALMTTHSRMGVFAALGGILTTLLIRLQTNRIRLIAVFLAVIAAGIGFIIYGEGLLDRLFHISRDTAWRFHLYDQVWQMIADRPLLGFGADSFVQAFPLYHAPPVPTGLTFYKAHSTYLANWLELGVVFGTLPLLIVGICLAYLMKRVFVHNDRRTESCVAIGVIVVATLHSVFDFSLEIEAITMIFTALVAMGTTEALETR
ncbi:O-antigen ligase family protein [Roseibium sp.]|uniref:O-antigen ligase family protein n=1 Tax=Roseibium sp. TaxID=1936156 RepID=UPI003A983D6C